MTRLPFITEDQLSDDQRRIWDGIVSTRGESALNDAGGLIGPFNAMLHSPTVGRRSSALGAAIRFETSVPRNLIEVAIITTGAFWKSNFEFWAHARMAHDAGVDQAAIDAIEAGEQPTFDNDDEQAVHAYSAALLNDGRVDDATYDAAYAVLGPQGIVEITSTVGYYCLISFLLNSFQVPLPDGETPYWPA